jgi:hypothetical protein
MGFGGSKSKSTAPPTGTDGLPKPTTSSITPVNAAPNPRATPAVQERLAEPEKSATLLQEDEEMKRRGVG